MKSVLKLGTRRSLLAMAQSRWVARQVELANPGVRVELVGIETRGDRIQDIPLTQVDGKDFFVAEIDQALISGSVDFTVHSMKDLSLHRSEEIFSGIIPKRENPRDVIVFGPRAYENLARGLCLKIGTSSPRRLENIPDFLENSLPHLHSSAKVPRTRFEEIRGNVNTRLSRVRLPVQDPKYLDGVVLAFAGLIRLAKDEAGNTELQKLLQECRWMVLPLELCPAAPAQGALMVECRSRDQDIKTSLLKIHHADTADQVAAERRLLAHYGGGCHQRFGATQIDSPELGPVMFLKGKSHSGEVLEDIQYRVPSFVGKKPSSGWNGQKWRSHGSSETLPVSSEQLETLSRKSIFVAHARAVTSDEMIQNLQGARIWTSGIESWFKLARMGLWVEGCAESLGFQSLKETLEEPVLSLPKLSSWIVLTHEKAVTDWTAQNISVLATYRVQKTGGSYSQEALQDLLNATHIFWSSGSQYIELKDQISKEIHHACGPGKTARFLREQGLAPLVFPSAKEWTKWLQVQ